MGMHFLLVLKPLKKWLDENLIGNQSDPFLSALSHLGAFLLNLGELFCSFVHPFFEVINCQSPKGYPEIGTVKSVDKRIDGRIDPAEPHEVIHDHFIHFVVFNEGRQ